MQTMQRDAARSLAPQALSASQAARMLGVSMGTIRRWSDLGQLDSFPAPSGSCRFDVSELHALLETRGPGSARIRPEASAHVPPRSRLI